MPSNCLGSFVIFVRVMILPADSRAFWAHDLFDTTRVGRVENVVNQSLRGLLARVDHSRVGTHGELLLIAAASVAGLSCAGLAYARLGDRWGLPTAAVVGLLVSPISWTHHWVWCVPLAGLLWRDAYRWLSAAAVFWTYLVWTLPHRNGTELHYQPLQIAASSCYVAAGVGFVVLTVTKAISRDIRQPPPRPRRDAVAVVSNPSPTVI